MAVNRLGPKAKKTVVRATNKDKDRDSLTV